MRAWAFWLAATCCVALVLIVLLVTGRTHRGSVPRRRVPLQGSSTESGAGWA